MIKLNLNNKKLFKDKKFICIIPARSGSKGIKNKNTQIVGGKPLIYWTIKEAIKSKFFSKVIVSTDSVKIKKISERYGAECPFLRPKKLSGDTTPTIHVIKHAVRFLKNYMNFTNYDYVVLLQPTSPLRKVSDIEESIKLFLSKKNPSSLISVSEVSDNHPARMYYIKNNFLLKHPLSEKISGTPRQKLKKMFLRNGAIYIINKLRLSKSFLGKKPVAYEMPKERSINIDDMFDLKIIKNLIKKNEK